MDGLPLEGRAHVRWVLVGALSAWTGKVVVVVVGPTSTLVRRRRLETAEVLVGGHAGTLTGTVPIGAGWIAIQL